MDSDCWDTGFPNGEICDNGSCVLEKAISSGKVRSVWPYGIGEYMDSLDLPTKESISNVTSGMTIIFPGSSQSSCLKIRTFATPGFSGGISYIRFNESKTNVHDGDSFEVWKTSYACNL